MGRLRRRHRPRIRRGDLVTVLSGEDKGKRGRVLRVVAETDHVFVEGVNVVYRHIRRSQQNPQGGRVRREAAIHISNVMLVDPDTNEPTKVGKRLKEPGTGAGGWVRVSRRTGEELGAKGGSRSGRKKKAKE